MIAFHGFVDERKSLSGAPTEFRFVGYPPAVAEAFARDIARLEMSEAEPRRAEVFGALLTPIKPRPHLKLWGTVFGPDGLPAREAQVRRHGEGVVVGRADEPSPQPPAGAAITEAIYGGVLFRGYGHVVLESLARLSPWVISSPLPLLFHVPPGIPTEPLMRDMLAALGADPQRFTPIKRVTGVERLHVPEPGFVIGEALNLPHIRFLRQALGAAGAERVDRPILLSRSALKGANRHAFGQLELEAWLRPHADIVHPEQAGFTDQVRLVNASSRYCGLVGSQMHNLLFAASKQPIEVLYFGSSQLNLAYFQIDLLSGGRKTYVNAATYEGGFEFGNGAPFLLDLERVEQGAVASGLFAFLGAPPTFDRVSLTTAYYRTWTERFLFSKLIRRLPALERSERITVSAQTGEYWRKRTRALRDPEVAALLRESAGQAFHRHRGMAPKEAAEAFMRAAFEAA